LCNIRLISKVGGIYHSNASETSKASFTGMNISTMKQRYPNVVLPNDSSKKISFPIDAVANEPKISENGWYCSHSRYDISL
jgi:hypothetical protein